MEIAYSLNGNLRLRHLSRTMAVVEFKAHGAWVWCVYRSTDHTRAMNLFLSQCRFHKG